MRTLDTVPFLALVLVKYDRFINEQFHDFIKKLIIRIGLDSKINKKSADVIVDTLYELQCENDLSDEMLGEVVELVKRYEVNIRL